MMTVTLLHTPTGPDSDDDIHLIASDILQCMPRCVVNGSSEHEAVTLVSSSHEAVTLVSSSYDYVLEEVIMFLGGH